MSVVNLTRNRTQTNRFVFGEDEPEADVESDIEWGNIIFLPFHPIFRLVILACAISKCILGPLQSVYPIIYCYDFMDDDLVLSLIKYYYLYCADTLYAIDTFLHIVHRQVTDKAMRREYLPKDAFLLLIDIFSLIPFVRITLTDECPPILLWPNILAFTEFVIIYRVVDYFKLMSSHDIIVLAVGYSLFLLLVINCVSCFLILITHQGLCHNCHSRFPFYDWRFSIQDQLNITHESFVTYLYSSSLIFSFALTSINDDVMPSALQEYAIFTTMHICGYFVTLFVVFPKLFAEVVLRLKKICSYYPVYKKLVHEARRRNQSPKAYLEIDSFFHLMWTKRAGIYRTPDVYNGLPRYLRLNIAEDMLWAIFYHSPLLRRSSSSLQRFLCGRMVIDYRLPGEKLFSGFNAHSRVYYIKSGVVQIISTDDGVTALISASSGTIFGDVSFHLPPMRRKTIVRCLTFCEVMYLPRIDYIQALHKYPQDRRKILNMVKDRMQHARTLYACKLNIRGVDRTEDEGIAWIKRRWWEISHGMNKCKRQGISNKNVGSNYVIPPEESIYHCSKYIGQMVLCSESQLKSKSLFVCTKFPWILVPNSEFNAIWYKIVTISVFAVLLFYPPMITSLRPKPSWFKLLQFWTDFVYSADIAVSILTAISLEESNVSSFAAVIFTRCKKLHFILDLLAALWIEYIVIIIGKEEYFYIVQFNRVIKIYMLFTGANSAMHINQNPVLLACNRFILVILSFFFICSHVLFTITNLWAEISKYHFFAYYFCNGVSAEECDPGTAVAMGTLIAFMMEWFYPTSRSSTFIDVCTTMITDYSIYLLFLFSKAVFVAAIYLLMADTVDYQVFVANLKKYYLDYKIHDNLMKRLNRYLDCHWQYFKGMDLMRPNIMSNEPYDVYWKVQGEVAEKIIGESIAFKNADPMLVRELAYAGKYMIIPRSATLFLFNVECKSVTWIVQGFMRGETYTDTGELVQNYYGPGVLLNTGAVFMSLRSLRTYAAHTDCEIFYLHYQDFVSICKRYPNEYINYKKCITEFRPQLREEFKKYLKKHETNVKNKRDYASYMRGASVSMDSVSRHKILLKSTELPHVTMNLTSNVWDQPESSFMIYWMAFRAFTVVVSILISCLPGSCGAGIKYTLFLISTACDCVACMDIFIKVFLAYRNQDGILIFDKVKCVLHYLTRGFLLDVIGVLPIHQIILYVMREIPDVDSVMIFRSFCKFCHLYIVVAFFNYLGDTPNRNVTFIRIAKWQVVSFLLMLGATQYIHVQCFYNQFRAIFLDNTTVVVTDDLIRLHRKNSCWLPEHRGLRNQYPSMEEMYIVFAESLSLAHCALTQSNFDDFIVDDRNLGLGVVLLLLGIFYWFVTSYSLALLVLNSKGNTLYQHGVNQLRHFLISERVDPKIIASATAHFTYWWRRTKGININKMTNERIGVVLRQDLNYYFNEKTLQTLDTLLKGGELVSRQIASACYQTYVLPNHEIIRENDIIEHIYIVHRGQVAISVGPDRLATLTKGCVFGILSDSKPRPSRISAKADDHTDLLEISIRQFQEIITEKVKTAIESNPQSQYDYLATKKPVIEDPYDTVQYIIGEEKTLKLPFILKPIVASQNKWYAAYLMVAWLLAPFFSVFFTALWMTFPDDSTEPLISDAYFPVFITLDAIHVINFIVELFSMEMIVTNRVCVKRVVGWRRVKDWRMYVDALACFVPLGTYFLDGWAFHTFVLLRLRLSLEYYHVFCQSFERKYTTAIQKLLIIILLLHTTACIWIAFVCRDDSFGLDIVDLGSRIDRDVWVLPQERIGGCCVMTKGLEGSKLPGFIMPRHWHSDYILAICHVTVTFLQSRISTAVTYRFNHIYLRLIVNILAYFINLYVQSIGINFMFTKLRELYQYDYRVRTLKQYLELSKISPVLVRSMTEYTMHLWARQRGNWLPELAAQAPMCLREDLMCALYVHHLETPTLFKELPPYFVRQLAARLKRIVVFPGKCIVQAGDMFSILYFIHEGEVEKWHVDDSGDSKMMSLLSTNGYFGLISGLFPNVAFQFSYISRTVVDLVYLRLENWQDLLECYPDVKKNLYNAARQQKKDFGAAYDYTTDIE